MHSSEEIQRDILNWRQRVIHICIILLSGLILLGACEAWERESNIEASPTSFIIDGVNLSRTLQKPRSDFAYSSKIRLDLSFHSTVPTFTPKLQLIYLYHY